MSRAVKNGMEQDVHTPWRHKPILQRSFVRYVKRQTNKRERREGRAEALREADRASTASTPRPDGEH